MIVAFYHIAQMGRWREIVDEQVEQVRESGLDRAASRIFVYVLGKDPVVLPEPFEIIYQSDNLKEYEYPALKGLHQFSIENPKAKILYFHSKAASKKGQRIYEEWRRYMMWGVVENWKKCVEKLDKYDTVGVEWYNGEWPKSKHNPMVKDCKGFYAGNFWWANAAYISTIPDALDLDPKNRWDAEGWLARNKNINYYDLWNTGSQSQRRTGMFSKNFSRTEYTGLPQRFFIITPCRNPGKNIRKCAKSILSQAYNNFQWVVVDDGSTDGTREYLDSITDKRVRVIKNKERKYALRNIVEAVDRYAQHDSIVITLDGDDYLSDPYVLKEIEQEYRSSGADALWTRYKNHKGEEGVSRALTHANPLISGWTASHLRTFRRHLLWGLNRELFKNAKGEWYTCAYDQALYLPILKLAKKKHFFNRVCMIYHEPEPSPRMKLQQKNALEIRANLKNAFNYNFETVMLFVNGPHKRSDHRLAQGERRHPLGVLSLARRLRARGHIVKVVDRYLNPGEWPKEKEILKYRVFGVYLSTPNFADGFEILKKLQKYRRKRYLMAGGPHCIMHPKTVTKYVDCVCVGEADFAISDMVERRISGIVDPGRVDDLDTVPFPDFDLIREQKTHYDTTWPFDDTSPVFPLNTSRSCPHSCTFCNVRDIWGQKWVAQSPERVFNDCKHLVDEFGAAGIYFREDNFACSERRVRAICALIMAKGLRFNWACEIRADQAAKPDLVRVMAEAGCRGFYVGAESGSSRMLKIFNKGITRQEILDTCTNAANNGIRVALSTINGHPEETDKDKSFTRSLIKRANPAIHWECQFRPKEK